jgi:hypothetical protein
MPFTPSHIAAALRFLRTPLIPAAVVVGTMAPDRDLSHSVLGLVTVDLLVGGFTEFSAAWRPSIRSWFSAWHVLASR